jgi:hypothetical protein
MKKLNAAFFIIPVLILIISCKKDNDTAPVLAPEGYWAGNFGFFENMGILNRPDGSSRFYTLLAGNPDTARAPLKMEGTYTVRGNVFHADYSDTRNTIRLETSHTTSNSMSGVLVLHFANIDTSNPFGVIKQQ